MWETLRWLIVLSSKIDQFRAESSIFSILDSNHYNLDTLQPGIVFKLLDSMRLLVPTFLTESSRCFNYFCTLAIQNRRFRWNFSIFLNFGQLLWYLGPVKIRDLWKTKRFQVIAGSHFSHALVSLFEENIAQMRSEALEHCGDHEGLPNRYSDNLLNKKHRRNHQNQ